MGGPGKKGGAGVIIPGVLFGFGEERKFPEHVPDEYGIAERLRREERIKSRAKMQEMPFKGAGAIKLGITA